MAEDPAPKKAPKDASRDAPRDATRKIPDTAAPEPTADADASPNELRQAEEALAAVEHAAAAVEKMAGAGETATVAMPNLGDVARANGAVPAGISLLGDVALRVKIELGRTRMYVEDVLRLNTDSVIELDKAAGDPVDIFVNDRHIARGEVLVLNENFCVRVSEIIDNRTVGE